MTILNLGVCAGRHEMPVTGYIFGEAIADPTNVVELEKLANQRVAEIGCGDNTTVNLYVTGLTVAVISAIKALKKVGSKILLKHFDAKASNYYTQEV